MTAPNVLQIGRRGMGEGSRGRDPGSSSHVICNFGPKNLQGRNVSKIHFQWDQPRSQSLNDATGRCLYRYRTSGAGTHTHTQTTAVEIAGADGKQTSQCCAASHVRLSRSRRRVNWPRQVSFWICTAARTGDIQDSTAQPLHSPPGACLLACFYYCVVRPFQSVALPRGKWRGAHRRPYS